MFKPQFFYRTLKLKFVPQKLWRWVFLLTVGVSAAGCHYQGGLHPMGKDYPAVQEARQMFITGNYPLAKEKFNALIENGTRPGTVRFGRYGLSCVALVTAETAETYLKILEPFLQEQIQAEESLPENGALLTRALMHGTRLVIEERQDASAEIAGLKTENRDRHKMILQLQQQIKTLEHQISSLETIDQELQEKRKNQ